MKRFEFKLESLLRFRTHLEQVAKQELARAVLELTTCQEQIQVLESSHKTWTDQLEKQVKKGVAAAVFRQHHEYLSAIRQMIAGEKQRERYLEKVVTDKRAALKKRSVDKKAMERLREKRGKEYAHEMLLAEQKELDEISSLKKAREISNGM